MAHRVAPLGNIGEDEEVEGEDPEESKEMARLELGADASPLPSQTPRSVRTKLSSDLMKHALNKARHNKTGMEYSPTRSEASPAKPAAMDDLTTEHGELVLKANRGTVVIERRLPPVLDANFVYAKEVFDPLHRNQQTAFLAPATAEKMSKRSIIRKFATKMESKGPKHPSRRGGSMARRSRFDTIISTAGEIVGVKRVDPWDAADFPIQGGAWLSVVNPNGYRKCYWDLWMALILLYAGLVTPFVIAFVAECSPQRKCLHFYLDTSIDAMFFVDLLLNFNTGFFHQMDQRWVIDRRSIAYHYVKSIWFYIDVISIFPFTEVTPKGRHVELVRAMKILRLVKIVRVLKIKRIADTYWNYIFLSYHTQAVLKFVSFMLVVAHWTACLIRTLSESKRGRYKTWLERHGLRDQGMWAEYLAAMVWAVQALNGTAAVYTVHEHFAAIVVLLVGCVVIAFMIGEIANVLTSLDPANNQYKMTMDLLGIFMNERGLARPLKRQLRNYFVQCEQVFRERCYQEMLENLTPQYREQIAVQNIGPWVRSLRVVQDAVVRASKIHPGMLVAVERSDDDHEKETKGKYRGAWVVRVHKHRALVDLCFQEEMPRVGEHCASQDFRMGVAFDRVTIPRFTPQGYAWHSSMNAYRGLVAELALILSPAVYIAHELIIQEGTENTTMFLLIRGNCLKTFKGLPMCWPKSTLVEDSTYACLGDDMMSCLVTDRRFSRRFIVRAVTKVQLYAMNSEKFTQKVFMASCDVLRKHMLRYVFWEFFHDTLWYRKEIIRNLVAKYRRGDLSAVHGYLDPAIKTDVPPSPVAGRKPPRDPSPEASPSRAYRTGFRVDAATTRKMASEVGSKSATTPAKPKLAPLRLPNGGDEPRPDLEACADGVADGVDRCREAVEAELAAFEAGGGPAPDPAKLRKLRRALLDAARDATAVLGDLDQLEDDLRAADGD